MTYIHKHGCFIVASTGFWDLSFSTFPITFQVAVLVQCGAIPPFCKLLDCMDTQVGPYMYAFLCYLYCDFREKEHLQW